MARKSYAIRLAELQAKISDIQSEAEELRDDLENWYSSMPDNLQESDKGSAVDTAKETVSELCDALGEAENISFDW